MTETIFVGHKPDTYKAYKTVGGWSIMFLDRNGNTRNADMSKVYPNRQNAYARVKRLNHPVQHAIKKTGCCEAYHDGYTIVVRENESGYKTVYTLYVKVGDMPPHSEQDFDTVEQVEDEIRDRSAFPLYLDWKAVKMDE